MAERLLDVKNLKTYFFTDEGTVRAVDGVDLYIEKGLPLAAGMGGSAASARATGEPPPRPTLPPRP